MIWGRIWCFLTPTLLTPVLTFFDLRGQKYEEVMPPELMAAAPAAAASDSQGSEAKIAPTESEAKIAPTYTRVRQVGAGTFGIAWLVRSASGRQYVMKEIPVTTLGPKERGMAVAEARILRQLKHPCVIRYRRAFVEEGILHICMEYAAGGDLHCRIKAQQGALFPEETIVTWLAQLTSALAYIHGRGILHRDIKAQNVFLSHRGAAKLGDFGISKVLTETHQHAVSMVGTPFYLSPEMCLGRAYNHKSDVWALGCLLYELMSLRPAFSAPTINAVIVRIIRGVYLPPSSLFSEALQQVLRSLLASSPDARPTAKELVTWPLFVHHVEGIAQAAAALESERDAGQPSPQRVLPAPPVTPVIPPSMVPSVIPNPAPAPVPLPVPVPAIPNADAVALQPAAVGQDANSLQAPPNRAPLTTTAVSTPSPAAGIAGPSTTTTAADPALALMEPANRPDANADVESDEHEHARAVAPWRLRAAGLPAQADGSKDQTTTVAPTVEALVSRPWPVHAAPQPSLCPARVPRPPRSAANSAAAPHAVQHQHPSSPSTPIRRKQMHVTPTIGVGANAGDDADDDERVVVVDGPGVALARSEAHIRNAELANTQDVVPADIAAALIAGAMDAPTTPHDRLESLRMILEARLGLPLFQQAYSLLRCAGSPESRPEQKSMESMPERRRSDDGAVGASEGERGHGDPSDEWVKLHAPDAEEALIAQVQALLSVHVVALPALLQLLSGEAHYFGGM